MKLSSQLKLKSIITPFLDWDKFSGGKIHDDEKALEKVQLLFSDIKEGNVKCSEVEKMLVDSLVFNTTSSETEKMNFLETMMHLVVLQCEMTYQAEYSERFNSPV